MSDRKFSIAIGLAIAAALIINNQDEIKAAIKKLVKWVKKLLNKEKAYVDVDADVNNSTDDDELKAFYCPISHNIMEDPVMTPYGHCFDRQNIEKWLEKNEVCPITMQRLTRNDLKRCYTLKAAIDQYKCLTDRLQRQNN